MMFLFLNWEMEFSKLNLLMEILHLGGDDFDQVIIDWLADEFKKDENY